MGFMGVSSWQFSSGDCSLGLFDPFEKVIFHSAAICLDPSSGGGEGVRFHNRNWAGASAVSSRFAASMPGPPPMSGADATGFPRAKSISPGPSFSEAMGCGLHFD